MEPRLQSVKGAVQFVRGQGHQLRKEDSIWVPSILYKKTKGVLSRDLFGLVIGLSFSFRHPGNDSSFETPMWQCSTCDAWMLHDLNSINRDTTCTCASGRAILKRES
ncbi:hypothetical protein TNCV_4905911 [Trichonephila clavipes]|uniref:Uncharacterized protein n=1 Tax=Trichonephila clavipes TaxID=2585209 RepID=A0A8X6RNZ7_TRICX|nr:hypothetical protein TNCV_4905911 [Trichonephila clavipes]